MRVLFLTVLVVVFGLGHLIAPNTFSSEISETSMAILWGDVSNKIPTSTPAPAIETVSPISFISRPSATEPTATAVPSSDTSTNLTDLFGNPKTVETFERGSSGFGLSAGLNDDEAIRIISLNNRLSLEPKKNNGWLSWRLRPPSIHDGAVEMEFSITTCARGDRAGIIMHAPDYTNGHGYYISLACEGTVSVLRDSTVLGSADVRNLFHANSGDLNKLTAIMQGDRLSVLLNDGSVLQIQDATYPEGFSGFFTAPQEQDTLRLDVISFTEYYPD